MTSFHNHSNWVALSRNDHHVRSPFDTAKHNFTICVGFHTVESSRHVADILITDGLVNGRLSIHPECFNPKQFLWRQIDTERTSLQVFLTDLHDKR